MIFVHRLNDVIIGSGANPQIDRAPEIADENNPDWVAYLNHPREHIDHSTASKLKLKRKLDELGVWASLRAVMVQDQDVWDEWLLAQDIDIDDPLVNAMRVQMEWTTQQVKDLFNSVN
ncbi:MAG: hypothetical protein Tp1111SUR522732_6 [Prokaryotic dsDNA virus sp.]|uniref:hypothetical protein n=1 Tax=Methylophaga sp. UBA2689 TaxID=1946878 RepID=UPI001189A307|nr:hypothetical protein [Methylophaga sp. UBA2689]QDP47068.1 MAG: hypothetical protein Tp1111SUR522732_6 [Prokaryotic dsDNA virus sp.]|tara:strand:+ start:540 stop:893 length:354 start_codon:yes stop_codon:yes gene_type:complete